MKSENKVIAGAFAVGIAIWLIDAIVDSFFFYGRTVTDLVLFDVPAHELYMRTLVLVALVLSGFVVSRSVKRYKAEEMRRRTSEEKAVGLFNGSPDLIWLTDEEGNIITVNKKASEMLGYSVEELEQMNLLDISGIKEKIPDRHKKIKSEGEFTFESAHVRKDGSKYPVEVHSTLIKIEGKELFLSHVRDITDRKKAEETLKESEEKFKMLSEQSLLGIDIIQDNRIKYANEALAKLMGYSIEEMLGWDPIPAEKIIHPDDLSFAVEQAKKKQNAEKDAVANYSYRLITKTGDTKWVNQYSKTVQYEGRPANLVTLIDITERKKAEEAQRESEKMLRESQSVAGVGSYILDITTGIWVPSGVLLDIFGIDEDFECNVEGWADIIHPEDRETMVNYFTSEVVGKCQRFDREYRIARQNDGETRWVWGIGELECDKEGKPIRMLGTIQDITGRKKAEESLTESEERYKTLSKASFEGVVLTEKGKVLEVNEQICKILGCKKSELVGKSVMDFVAPESKEFVIEKIKSGYNDPYEHLALKKDGTRIPVEVHGRMTTYKGKEVRVTAIRDLTGQKKAEEQMKADIEEKEVLLREIHHRVKNNLQIISSILSLEAENKGESELFKDTKARIKTMSLIHEKLYQAKSLAKIRFKAYLDSLGSYIFNSFRKPGKSVKFINNSQDLELTLDLAIPSGLIATELITNSIKYAFKDTKNGTITINFQKSKDNMYTLTVEDDGTGLPENIRAEEANTMGLSLISSLVSQLDANMEIDRKKGTKFTITFSGTDEQA
jgi:PAS domain S-box-containing protein